MRINKNIAVVYNPGPEFRRVLLMSDVGADVDIADVNLGFDDSSPDFLPDLTSFASGTYHPSNYDDTPTDSFTAGTNLSVFNGSNPMASGACILSMILAMTWVAW